MRSKHFLRVAWMYKNRKVVEYSWQSAQNMSLTVLGSLWVDPKFSVQLYLWHHCIVWRSGTGQPMSQPKHQSDKWIYVCFYKYQNIHYLSNQLSSTVVIMLIYRSATWNHGQYMFKWINLDDELAGVEKNIQLHNSLVHRVKHEPKWSRFVNFSIFLLFGLMWEGLRATWRSRYCRDSLHCNAGRPKLNEMFRSGVLNMN